LLFLLLNVLAIAAIMPFNYRSFWIVRYKTLFCFVKICDDDSIDKSDMTKEVFLEMQTFRYIL